MTYDDRNINDDFRGRFSNDDGDGNENVKKAVGLLRKTTTLHVQHPLVHSFTALARQQQVVTFAHASSLLGRTC